MRFLLLALLACTSTALAGNGGVLIADLPDVANEDVIAAARGALTHRRWTIESSGETRVSASISRHRTTSRITISISGDTLVYEEESTKSMSPTRAPSAAFVQSEVPIRLGKWIESLRFDIRTALAATPRRSESVVERLKALDSLRANGLVTEQEHAAKRAAILGGL
jgi:hypothetical protein